MSLVPAQVHCCDASSLIPLRNAGLLRRLRGLALNGQLKVPAAILGELKRRSEAAKEIEGWSKAGQVVVDLAHQPLALGQMPRIERTYGPRFKVGQTTYAGF